MLAFNDSSCLVFCFYCTFFWSSAFICLDIEETNRCAILESGRLFMEEKSVFTPTPGVHEVVNLSFFRGWWSGCFLLLSVHRGGL